jgi:hypothetical protein
MIRYVCALLAAAGLLAAGLTPGAAQDSKGAWGTIKGRVVWGGKAPPKADKVNVTADKPHCLGKGDLFDNLFEVGKTNGLKNVFVALKQAPEGKDPLPIHPSLQKLKEAKVSLDQPRCLFMPRAVAVWEGQKLIAKNSSPVNHNIRWTGDPDINEGGNVTLPPGKSYTIKNLKTQPLPLMLQCNIHPWMSGRLAVYDHPYFAVTDADGNFEIKLAPAGKQRVTFYHEGLGWLGGAKGKAGQEITVEPGKTVDLGEVKMGK